MSKFVLRYGGKDAKSNNKSNNSNNNNDPVEVDTEMETYFSVHNRTVTGNRTIDIVPELAIPASFCVDSFSNKVLACPRTKLASTAKVLKCCPFGKELKHPLLSGCIQSDLNPVRLHLFKLSDQVTLFHVPVV